MTTTEKVWFITGASRGFGREFAIAALERGDRVAATARDASTLEDLVAKHGDAILPLQLDVTNKDEDFAAVAKARDTFGRLDVVINNAGYGHFGAVEELTEDDIRAQMETNFYGLLWITQAALPIMRAQQSGHIIQISSIGGVGAFAGIGAYHASKWAVEGLSEALSKEVADFGIHVTIVEPGGFSTDWSGPSAKHSDANPVYDGIRDAMRSRRAGSTPGDPAATCPAILDIVDAPEPPLRVLFGEAPIEMMKSLYADKLTTWDDWAWVSRKAQG